MIRLSVVIITFNEEKNIGRCLESVGHLADEIVIVDSFSTDQTKTIAGNFGAKFISHPFEGYIEQKNFAITQASFDHILSLDADEVLSDELKKSIGELKQNWTKENYSFNRLTNYCGKFIKHGGWYPDTKLRLFIKGKGKWGGTNPHDKFIPSNPASSGKLKGDLLHYSFNSIAEHLVQTNNFATISAESLFKNGKHTNIFAVVFKPIIKFIRDYFILAGFLDGYYGFIACRISAYGNYLKYRKLLRLKGNK